MINLLPQKYKSSQASKYKFRRLIVACGFIFVLSMVSLTFFVPAYILKNAAYVESEPVGTNESNGSNESSENAEGFVEILASLSRASILVTELNTRLPDSNVYETMLAFQNKSSGIKINEISYTNRGGDSNKIIIRGVAANREDLTNFGRFLEARPEFDQIDLPISSFTKESNIDFSLTAVVVHSN